MYFIEMTLATYHGNKLLFIVIVISNHFLWNIISMKISSMIYETPGYKCLLGTLIAQNTL